jgi:sulfate transport system ATP-binding protein
MEPATPFVVDFVGETNKLPDGSHVRPHDIELVESGAPGDSWAVVVDNVFRKGGAWRIEGVVEGNGVIEIDLDADRPAPTLGSTIRIRPVRSKTFTPNGAQP